MKLVVAGILLLLGVASWAAFFLTFEKPVCLSGCGCWPGEAGESVFVSFFGTKFKAVVNSRQDCLLTGYGPSPQKPIYWDLGLMGVALAGAGLVSLVKGR